MSIGDKIRSLRHAKGMTVDSLAAACKKTRATIYRYEKDATKDIPKSALVELARALDTTVSYLVGNPDTWIGEDELSAQDTPSLEQMRAANTRIVEDQKNLDVAILYSRLPPDQQAAIDIILNAVEKRADGDDTGYIGIPISR